MVEMVDAMEPRSLTVQPDRWLTDSRVYNLLWLGRWLERAESVSRSVNGAARRALAADEEGAEFAAGLGRIADSLGVALAAPDTAAGEILLRHPASAPLQCLVKARMNATQVAPVELMRAIAAVIMELEELEDAALSTPQQVKEVTDGIAAGLAEIYQAIEDRWFGRESLTEEEAFRRFVQ